MTNEILPIANEARIVRDKGINQAQQYIALKGYQYEFLNVLNKYVPLLLQEEAFFIKAFV